ncbi:hypothetical protein ACQP1W_02140 [Spirillospora sp. CA-255316]
MSSILDADAFYRTARRPSASRWAIGDACSTRFAGALRALLRDLEEDASSSVWEPIVSAARAVRWRGAIDPVPFTSNHSSVAEPLAELLDLAGELSGSLDHQRGGFLDELVTAATAYRDSGNMAYARAVLECLSSGDPSSTCLAVARSRRASPISEWLAETGQQAPVLGPREFLESGRVWDLAILPGAGDWFPPHMLLSARAEEITLVHPRWVRDSHRFYGVFGEFATRTVSVTVREPPARDIHDPPALDLPARELVPQPDWSLVAASAPRPLVAGHPTEPCKLAVLGGGYAIWLPVGAQRIRGLIPAARAGERVVNLPIKGVHQGAILLLRLGSTESAALRPLVDSLLGSRQATIRSLQEEWKACLRSRMAGPGATELSRRVRARGAQAVNLQHWATDDSIRPRDDRDFRALLEVLGLLPAEPYIEAGRTLRRAHAQAGHALTQALEEHVEHQDFAELEFSGLQELRLEGTPGLAAMVAFRVIAVSPNVTDVPSNHARHPFRPRGAAWLE